MQRDDSLPERAYYRLLKKLGRKESAPNQGPIVNWAIAPWTKKKADETAWASWCAGAVCTAYLEAESLQMKEIGTLSVQTLFERLQKRDQVIFWQPQQTPLFRKGDLIFFGTAHFLHHVGLIDSYSSIHGFMSTLEGNHQNSVSMASRREWYAIARILY